MQRRFKSVSILLITFLLPACGQANIDIIGDAEVPTIAPSEPPSATPTLPPEATETPESEGLSFISETYRDDLLGFELEYPTDWDDPAPLEEGARGRIVQASMDGLPMLNIAALQWDPPNDLPAYLQVRETAFENSGFSIVDKEVISLEDDQSGVGYHIETVEGEHAYFFFTTLNDEYLQLSGTGDLDLLAEIASTLKFSQ